MKNTARVHRLHLSFATAILYAAAEHAIRDLGIATVCYVNPAEPDRVPRVGTIEIVEAEEVPVNEIWASAAGRVEG